MLCTKCGTSNPPANNFCAHCGSALVRVCVNCKAESPSTSNFCGRCGASLGESASSSVEPPEHASIQIVAPSTNEHLTGERKTVTALFADIEGSTELMRNLDPEEARAIVDPALRIMVEAVRRYDGYVVQSTGDGIFALFGAPLAHEDHPQRALYAALQMQQGLREYRQQLAAQGRPVLEARIGVNTGEVVVRTIDAGERTEYTPIGHTANLASRLQTVSPVGSISVSEDTRKLVEGYFELRALGPIAIKGISEPINVFEVIGLGALRSHFELAARRGLTRFVGRDGELGQMDRALERAMGRHGQIVAVVAEAGTGKSRLFYEFKATIPAECKVLEAYSVSHGKASAWLPVLELLRKYFGFGSTDDAATRRQKATAVLKALDPSLTDALPYLFGLLGIVEGDDPLAQMDGQVKKRRTLDAIKRIILRESLIQPLVVIFEDLHWIDGQTQDFLNLLVDSIGTAKILVLVNYRPEYSHQWGSKTYYTQLRLDPLEREGAEQMLSALLGGGVEVAALKRVIIEKTDGNPFFIEETVQVLFDEGALVLDGRIKLTRPLAELKIPPTVQAILASRIDRSPRDVKELLQTLAVIGREFSLSLIRAVVAKPDDQLHHLLNDLQLGEFIYEQPTVGENEYIFKHALTQEVAYGSVLVARRKILHERVGHALESMYDHVLEDHIDELAHHYSRSDNLKKGVEYIGRAGQQAMQRCSYLNAIQYVSDGLDRLKLLPDDPSRLQQELSFKLTLGVSLMATKGWAVPEVADAFGRAEELCHQLGEVPQLAPVLYGIWGFCMVSGQLTKATKLGNKLLTLARAADNRVFIVAAHYTLSLTFYWMGDLKASERNFIEMTRYYSPSQRREIIALFGNEIGIGGAAYRSMGLWLLGYPDKSLEVAEDTLRTARDLAHPETLAWALLANSIVRQLRTEKQQTRRATEEIFSLCEANGQVMQPSIAKLLYGWVLAADGSAELGCKEIREGFRALNEIGLVSMQAQGHAILADAYLHAANADEGLRSLDERLTRTEGEDYNFAAELSRLRGELLLLRAGTKGKELNAEAEALFREAIAIARHQSAKSLELRAVTSLARVLRNTGRREEARSILSEIYNWFTEGFDTRDLKEAKALLDELAM